MEVTIMTRENIVGVIGEKIDKFILSANFNSSDFAMYSVAQFRLPIISLIFPAVSNVLGPQIAVCGKEGDLIKAKIYWHKIIEKLVRLLFIQSKGVLSANLEVVIKKQ